MTVYSIYYILKTKRKAPFINHNGVQCKCQNHIKKECFSMKIITQISMFDDTQNENLGDLERLQKVFDNLPDEKLIRRLKEKRGKGRNEWPVEAMWNSFIASFIFDHDSIASLLRELNRNSQLRIICGFQPHIYSVLTDKKDEDVPDRNIYNTAYIS